MLGKWFTLVSVATNVLLGMVAAVVHDIFYYLVVAIAVFHDLASNATTTPLSSMNLQGFRTSPQSRTIGESPRSITSTTSPRYNTSALV